jgi:hypothetical protein
MSAQAVDLGSDQKEGRAMTRRGFALGRPLAAFAAVAALALGLSGDRTSAAGVPAPINGTDPLEVLELKVRPNVIIVLDSSGSMTQVTDTAATDTLSGDHPRSKLFQAKTVLRNFVQQNQNVASFQFLTYTQVGESFSNQSASTIGNRFQYYTSAAPAATLLVRGAVGDTLGRGLQSWQIIQPAWNRLYFGETGGVVCYATIPGTPRFYNSGATLAADLQTAMNAATCTTGSSINKYTVTYATGTGVFTFARSTGTNSFQIRWADTPNSIRGALGRRTTANTSLNTTAVSSGAPYRLLYRAATGNSGGEIGTVFSFNETIGGVATTWYQAAAGHLWNGEVVRVQSDGTVCGVTFPTPAQMTNPPRVTLQLVSSPCGADTAGSAATFDFAGSDFGGNNRACRGGMSRVPLIPCDLAMPPAATQITNISPYIDPQLPFDGPTAIPRGYTEAQDGSWTTQSVTVQPSAKADGNTPLGTTLIDIKGLADGSAQCLIDQATSLPCSDPTTQTCVIGACVTRNFAKLWDVGQVASPGPPQAYALDPIKNHLNPKEKTIVLFVTDGNDTCPTRADGGGSETDASALRAAYYAERLYTPIVKGDLGSSVQTIMIGYGGAFSGSTPTRLNWIAWGGSGLGQGQPGQPDVPTAGTNCESWGNGTLGDQSGSSTPALTGAGQTGSCAWNAVAADLTAQRAQCTTCQDAFVAPDAATLARQLQSIIDQGASDGDFNAQQSITESVFEYVDRVPGADARMPTQRYTGIVPTRFVSSFSLPGFKGQLRAYQDDGSGNSVLLWSAGDRLSLQVSTAMNTCNSGAAGGNPNECVMTQLHAGATDSTIAGSTAKIKRRIYTTSRNGVYTYSPDTLMAGTLAERATLWPPAAGVLPNDYTSVGLFDAAMGFPPNSPTSFPPNSPDLYCNAADTTKTPKKSYDQCWLDAFQRDFKACLGTNLPGACTNASVNTQMLAARREARDISLAFLAGAAPVPSGAGLKRTSAAFSSAPAQSVLYKAQPWILADSELATAAVVTPPSLSEPEATPYVAEYKLYRDGAGATGRTDTDVDIRRGFGLTSPDDDQSVASHVVDLRSKLKPVMTVIYAPANDMLHAFRAGPNCSPAFTAYSPLVQNAGCAEKGGEELWGFVPFDQLGAVRLRAANQPQGRTNHVFMLARGIRFGDVFVPGAMTDVSIGGTVVKSMQGVWRRVLYFGRGIGGKYVTALDVTAPGPYTATALSTTAPVPLWNRGNPDTQDGLASGTLDGTSADRDAYARMGETWSLPTVAYVNSAKSNPLYVTTRRPDGVDFVIFMGSGYGNPNAPVREGTTHYTLDALSGDVVAAVDVEDVAASYGLTRSGLSYPNAIVANSVSFNRSAFTSVSAKQFNVNPHPWSFVSTRVYVGDIHGRLWKFLTAFPNVAVPAADLGADQPVGTAVALLGQDMDPLNPDSATTIPNIFVSSGAERRAAGPFRNFSLRDEGTDTAATTTGSTVDDGVTTFTPVVKNFARTFDQGTPEANCGPLPEAVFRGTIQPTSALECTVPVVGSKCQGDLLQRVFFGGTRLSLPNTKFAPPTPLACSAGQYPCRSQFDSILYALGVQTGQAAYDLNANGDDAYRIFRDSRIAAIGLQADPNPGAGGARFAADEGLMKGTPKPPPIPGVPPTATTATANVILKREPGQPAPAVQYGSTVCQ